MSDDSLTSPATGHRDRAGEPAGSLARATGREEDAGVHDWLCGSCPLRSPYRERNKLPTGLSPAPTVAQARLHLSVDWTPFTARIRGRATLAVRSADFRSRMAAVLGFVQRGDVRIVLLRQRLPLAAIVPLPDYWFLLQIEEELRKLGWPKHRRHLQAERVARAIVAVQHPTCYGEPVERHP